MNSKWILRNLFCGGFNLSNDDIISVICKHVMLHLVTAYRSENGYGTHFFGLKSGQDLDWAAHPHQSFSAVQPPSGSKEKSRFKSIVRNLMDRSSTISSLFLYY